VRIVITDSGLGGLSVVAGLETRLKKQPIFENVELIFFNSLYSVEFGYSLIDDFSDKVKIFNNALNSIENNFQPDLILIACNTLSVVYPHTKFSQNSKTEVKGILDSGVDLFKSFIQERNDKIIIFGTPTTIISNVYNDELINAGIKASQIVNQACPDLESEIQRDPISDITKNSISKFVKEAAGSAEYFGKTLYAGLCCTHYGYSENVFLETLSLEFNCEVKTLNPNTKMLDFLFDASKKTYSNAKVTVRVVTQVILRESEIKSLSNIFSSDSPKTATALRDYEYIQNLFEKV